MKKFCFPLLVLWFLASPAAHAQWQALNGPPGANVRDMERAPNGTLYIVSNLKLFASTNDGDAWQEVAYQTPSVLDLEGITSDAAGNLYGVNYSRAFKSTDNGLNWQALTVDGDFYGIYDVKIFGPNNYIVVYGWNGVYVSIDAGASWLKIWDREPFDLKSNAAGDLFITTSNNDYTQGRIMRYAFPGTTGTWDIANWVQVYSNASSSGYDFRLLIDASSRIYASVLNDLILSVNNGSSWTSIKGTLTDSYFSRPVWGLSTTGIVYLTNSYNSPSKIYSTANQGGTWATVTSATENYGSIPTRLAFGSGATSSNVFLGSDGDGVFRSENNGSTWTQKSAGLKSGNGKGVVVANDGRIIYLSNYRLKGYWTSTNNGSTWTFVPLADYIQKVVKLSDGKILLYSGGPVYQSANNGLSFTKVDDKWINTIAVDLSGNLYGIENIIYKSVDQGDNWIDISPAVTGLPAGGYYCEHVAIDDSNANLFAWLYEYSSGKYRLYRIPVAGGAATVITSEPWINENSYYNVNNVFVSNGKLYVAEANGIYESSDNGSTWNSIRFSGQRVFPIPGGLCVSRQGALYVTQDGGKSWNNSSLPDRNSLIWNLVPVSDGFIAAGTNSSALKFTGQLILPPDQLPPYIDFEWEPTDGPYGGYISKVFKDNVQNSYSLSDGRLFKTLTFSSWDKVEQGDGGYIYDVIIDQPNNAIYSLKYNALLKSTTGGASWTTINTENIPCRQRMVRCANGNIAFATGCGQTAIYVSIDGGTTFGSQKLSLGQKQLEKIVSTSATNGLFLNVYDYTTNERKLKRSKDNGTTWEDIATPIPDYQIGADAGGNLFIYWSNTVYKSGDDGASWVNISGDLPSGYISYNAEPFTSPSGAFLLAGYRSSISKTGFWKTTNGGVNWTFIPFDFEPTSLTSVGSRIVAGTYLGVYTSDDEAQTFSERSTGINLSDISDLELINPSHMISLVYGNPSHSSNDFDTWQRRTDLPANRFIKNPDGTLIAFGGRDFFKTEDNGQSWIKVGSASDYITHAATADGQTYFITTQSNKIQYSNNLTTWTELTVTGLPDNFSFQSISINTSGFVFVVIYNNGSNQWEAYQILYGGALRIILGTQPRNVLYTFADQKTLLYDQAGSIFETTDGSAWITKPAPNGEKLMITEKGYYFISQYDGTLWLSRNKGQSWQSVGVPNSANTRFQDVLINEFDGHAYAALYDRVIHKSKNIVLPPETAAPVVASLVPANNSNNIIATTTLIITFDEVVNPVAGKKIRIIDFNNPINPVEIIDVTAGSKNGKTFIFTPTNALVYEKTYFIAVDVGAFTDVFNNAFAGIATNSTWKFTIQEEPDATKPVISHSLNNPAFTKSGANKIQITATDDGGSGVNASTVKMFYRGITVSGEPVVASMTLASGNTFEVTVQDNWLDELGMEYRFEASDNSGNVQTFPIDGSYYKGYIAFPENQNPTLPTSVLSSGGQRENYRIFSIPHKLTNASINTQLSEITSGTPGTDYRILNYNPDTDTYSEYPGLSSITRGSGYWINIKNPATIAIENASTPENSKDQLFSFTLKPGWNQIGNPYPFTISWNLVKGSNTNIGVLKSFNGSGWLNDDKLNPFEGGFVLYNGTSNTTIPVPFSARTTSDGRTNDDIELDFERGWWLPLRIENSRAHSLGGVGMHPEAVGTFDQFDDAMPPKVFDMPEILFPHAEHFLKNFTRDVVPPHDEFIWDFTVHSGEEAAVLNWDNNAVLLLANELYLFDEHDQILVDMSEESSWTIASKKSSAFKLYYGISRERIKPSKIALGKPYPNPFTQESNVSFTLPENNSGAYNVSLSVYDMLGRKIANLTQGEYSSGFYTKVWRPEPGEVNASLYFYRLTVSDNTTNIVLTEKIFIQK